MTISSWFLVRRELTASRRKIIGWASFLTPLLIWCAVSYVPFIWHPVVKITQIGEVDYFQEGMRVDKATFYDELEIGRAHV